MKTLTHKGEVIALIFDKELEKGSVPLTSAELPLQVIGLNHPKGKIWPFHIHEPKTRTTEYGLEVLFVLEGKARVQIIIGAEEAASLELKKSEGLMVLKGAIRVEAEEDLKALEFKNGPFMEDKVMVKTEREK